MATQFAYRARRTDGGIERGVLAAASEADAARTLQQRALLPLRLSPQARGRSAPSGRGFFRAMKTHTNPLTVALFTRQMASMVGAGLSLVRALRSAARDQSSARFARIVEDVARQVEEGQSLSQAMSAYPGTFDRIYTGLLQTAEVSGNLDTTFAQLAEYLERSETIRAKVKAALRYPYFVFGTMIAVLALMLLKIIPMFAKIYQGLDFPLPRPTQILVNVSTTLVHNLPMVLGIVAMLVLLARLAGSSTRGRLALDHMKLKIPIMGKLLHLYTISRFARTLGILLASGTQVLYALEVSRAVAGSLLFERRIDRVRQEVETGTSMAVSMRNAQLFPETMLQMVATGEETGRLDDMLVRSSNFYEQQVTAAVDGLSSLIEPVIIVSLGSIVGMMILALYYPIFMMGTAIRSGM